MNLTIYDCSQFSGKPGAAAMKADFGFKPAICPSAAFTCTPGPGPRYASAQLIEPLAIAALAAKQLLIFDIEFATNSAIELENAIDIARDAAPGLTIGIFGIAPDCGPACVQATQFYWRLAEWIAGTKAVSRLIDLVDVLCPGFYCSSDADLNARTWALAAGFARARSDKPLLPFVSNRYLGDAASDLVPDAMLQNCFGMCADVCDGCVLWTNPGEAWDPGANFIATAKRFAKGA